MAETNLGYLNVDKFVGFVQEQTFQTAIADNITYAAFELVGGTAPDFEPTLYSTKDRRNRGRNMPDVADTFVTSNGQIQRYEIPEFYCPINHLGSLLYAVGQNVVEGATTPFEKTFTFDGTVDPDFSSDEGFFFTLLIKSPIASRAQKLTSCVLETLTVKFSGEAGGRCICSGTVISMSGYTLTSNPSNSPAFTALDPANYFDAVSTMSLAGTDLTYKSVTYTLRTQYKWVGDDAGLCQNMKVLSQSVEVEATVLYDTNSAVIPAAKGTDAGIFLHDIGLVSAAGHFQATLEEAFIDEVSSVDAEDELQMLTFKAVGLIGTTSTDSFFVTADAVDKAW